MCIHGNGIGDVAGGDHEVESAYDPGDDACKDADVKWKPTCLIGELIVSLHHQPHEVHNEVECEDKDDARKFDQAAEHQENNEHEG